MAINRTGFLTSGQRPGLFRTAGAVGKFGGAVKVGTGSFQAPLGATLLFDGDPMTFDAARLTFNPG
jgi:hypothetical protein